MWYAVQVMTGEEENTVTLCRVFVKEHLLTDIFYPRKEVMKRYSGEWHKHVVPIFPGYIFAVTESAEQLYGAFKSVPKLVKLLGTGKEPVALEQDEVQFISKIINKKHVTEISVGFIEGSKLTVQSGPMVGMEGMVKKINRHKRTAQLEVEMFGRQVEMILGLEVLEKQ